ncbi:MAG TPA: ABC transporter permease [Stackebrandtia sp.]|jgi:molybdate transport system permease protein|uniref:ABC transporter permease n=1 Tax=Stackebrandtia sp. TaxID=2023065 RepID=UPI002D248ECE|nr:ABC transporter permease [Stackebrandtia sp.]HZE40632.1 ABC transporter permease [Stackebrandtia sp.]
MHRRRVPLGLGIPAFVGLGFLVVPLVALLTRVPWARLWTIMTASSTIQVLSLSVGTACASTLLCLLLGTPLAWVLVHCRPRTRRVLRTIVTMPLIAPPVVGGVALLAAYGRRGVAGAPVYELFGVALPFTTAAVVVAQTFVALPFCVLAIEGALHGIDPVYAESATIQGAGRFQIFRYITFPLAAPGVVAGATLAFARALGEFGATLTFAGSLPGVTQTAPLAIYQALDTDPAMAYGLSLLLLAVAAAVLLSLKDSWWPR